MRKWVLLSIAAGLALILTSPAIAQEDSALEVSLSSAAVVPGGSITVTGEGCGPSEVVTITSASGGPGGLVDETNADEDGAFSHEFVFPENLVTQGPSDLNVFCDDVAGEQQSGSFDIEIVSELPFTGPIGLRPIAAIGLIALGVAFIVAARPKDAVQFSRCS